MTRAQALWSVFFAVTVACWPVFLAYAVLPVLAWVEDEQ